MNYAFGYAFNLKDLYTKFPYHKLKFNGCSFPQLNTCNIVDICTRVMSYCIFLVIKDIIKNNVTFILPTNKRYAELYVRRTSKEEFTKRRQKGGEQDIDFLETNFTTYKLMYRWQNGKILREKPCYVGSELKEEFINNINNGMKYC